MKRMESLPGFSFAPAIPAQVARARRLLWLVCLLLALTLGLGRAWDSAWHAAHRFESFYSPPHICI
jgi:hypothetical protein